MIRGVGTSSTTKYANYNSRESAMEAAGLVINWFLELGPDTYIYTQENSLTMDVMASPGIAEFKEAWAAEDYPTPFTYHQTIDDRGQGITPKNIGIFFREHLVHNALAQLGFGSKQAEGTVDSVGGVIGSLDRIDAVQYDENNVAFVVHNRMDWASATRFPGEDISLLPSKPRSDVRFGGTVWQIFYWTEPNPTP